MATQWSKGGVVQVQLGERTPAALPDPMNRTVIGSWQGQTPSEAWTAGRGVWRFNASRVLDQAVVRIVDTSGTIMAVGTIAGVLKHGDRFEIVGVLDEHSEAVGQPTPYPHPSRNPIAYC